MTPAAAFAFFLSLYCLWWFYGNQGSCIACGGKGKHKDGCPDAD